MKAKLIVIFSCMMLCMNSFAFACDGGCQNDNPCGETCMNNCECANLYQANPCMSTSEYCEVYGNIGALGST